MYSYGSDSQEKSGLDILSFFKFNRYSDFGSGSGDPMFGCSDEIQIQLLLQPILEVRFQKPGPTAYPDPQPDGNNQCLWKHNRVYMTH